MVLAARRARHGFGRWCFWLVWCTVLAGCASGSGGLYRVPGVTSHWQGRLAIKVTQPQTNAFAAAFELQGNAEHGQLTLSTPLGTTLATLNWAADAAFLTTTGTPQRFDSVQALTLYATGVDIPVAQLFAWLRGNEAAAPGWEVDLRDFELGRVSAKRSGPDLQAELKIVIER